jgi:hypothetical protein
MPALNEDEKALLGPPVSPFERSEKAEHLRVLRDGEDHRAEFEDFIYDAIDDDKPTQSYVELEIYEIDIIRNTGTYREKCFLWVIDDNDSIKMIRETTRNALRTHDPYVCHTNLTGAGKAYLGGELFFCEDGNIYVSPKSDRYGWPSPQQWQAALNYFRRIGYGNLVDIWEWM